MNHFNALENIDNLSRLDIESESEREFYKKTINASSLTGCYCCSWAYIWQIAGERGYKYYDGRHLLTLTPGWGGVVPDELVINSDQNQDSARLALQLAQQVSRVLGREVKIRKVYGLGAQQQLENAGFFPLKKKLLADDITLLPDDNYPERVVDIALQSERKGKKYQWLRNGLNVLKKNIDLNEIAIKNSFLKEECLLLLDEWSAGLASRLVLRYGFSHAEGRAWIKSPYPPLFDFFIKYRKEDDLFPFLITYKEKAVAVFCGCRVAPQCVALYANFSLTEPRYLALYIATLASDYLGQLGFCEINLGGSEIAELDFFKRKCGGDVRHVPRTYVVGSGSVPD